MPSLGSGSGGLAPGVPAADRHHQEFDHPQGDGDCQGQPHGRDDHFPAGVRPVVGADLSQGARQGDQADRGQDSRMHGLREHRNEQQDECHQPDSEDRVAADPVELQLDGAATHGGDQPEQQQRSSAAPAAVEHGADRVNRDHGPRDGGRGATVPGIVRELAEPSDRSSEDVHFWPPKP